MAPASSIRQLARSTAFRLALVYIALFVGAAALVAAVVIRQTNAAVTDQVLRGLRSEREELVLAAEVRGLDALAGIVAERSRTASGRLYLLSSANGARIAGNLPARPVEFSGSRSAGLFTFDAEAGGGSRTAAGAIVQMPGGTSLLLGRDVEDQRRLTAVLRRLFLWSFAALALTGLFGGVIASRMLLKRIDAVNATSRRIMAGELGRRIPVAGSGDELDELSANLNAMLDRIEQLIAGMREVSDNVAHDLKTPLNRLRSRAEAALRDERGNEAWREGLERVIEDADDLIRTFNALLLIAKLDAGAMESAASLFDLSAVVRDVAELYEPVAEEVALSLVVRAPAALMVRANRELIGQAVANLVDNAIKYSARSGGTLPVEVSLSLTDNAVEVTVADRGPGIPEKDRDRALGRFVRLDTSRSKPGTGLGLNLVAAVARLHGGRVVLGDNSPGLKVVLSLPTELVVSRAEIEQVGPGRQLREPTHAGSG